MSYRFPIPYPIGHSYELVRVKMCTGKYAGLVITIPDIAHVIEAIGPTKVRVLLPGLEGYGLRIADTPQDN